MGDDCKAAGCASSVPEAIVTRRRDGLPRNAALDRAYVCPILGADWERRSAARCGQKRSDAITGARSMGLTCGNVPELGALFACALSCGPGCRGFESPRSPHRKPRSSSAGFTGPPCGLRPAGQLAGGAQHELAPVARWDELVLLPVLHSPDAQRVDLIRHARVPPRVRDCLAA